MKREKIISLARECGVFEVEYPHPGNLKEIEAFYHAAIADFLKESGLYITNDLTREYALKQARDEVLEEAAKKCDVMANGWENNPGNNPMAGHVASSNCAYEIRSMKETK